MTKRELKLQANQARFELLKALSDRDAIELAQLPVDALAIEVANRLRKARAIWRDVNVGLGTIQGLVSDVRRTHKDEPEEW